MMISTLTLALFGYIGPGGGIALLGPLVGVLMAVVGALAMVAIWPIRYMLKKGRETRDEGQETEVRSPASAASSPQSPVPSP